MRWHDEPDRRTLTVFASCRVGAMVVWAVQKPWLKQNLPYRANFPAFPALGGFGGGFGGNAWQQRRPPPTVPADFQAVEPR